MIIAPDQGSLLFVTQHDHAHFASELLSLWCSEGLPTHPRRRELLWAALEHDNGWREIDSAPMICARDGKPHDFMTMPTATRWEIWRRGTTRYLDTEPYAALLIVRHALRLHRSHRDDPDWADILAEWSQLETAAIEAHGFDSAMIDLDYRWIDLTDSLSLTACCRWTDELKIEGYRAQLRVDESSTNATPASDTPAGETLCIEPFPLAGATTLKIACRRIPRRTYTSDTDLAIELASARWQPLSVRIAPF